ncbi:hypothetical protein [uncultured Roseobacter sp.]|uniref:hypothetical protein n=1 Tax=uncultured Roseobacter sp. TaxID=114847 RepID=UPI00262DBB24|nr:hypothetical protein [uncultured Roseobacter sp.]
MEVDKDQIRRMVSGFRQSDFASFRSLVAVDENQATVIGEILNELEEWCEQDWIDEERIAFLGRDLRRAGTEQFYQSLTKTINSSSINVQVKRAFFSLSEVPQSKPSTILPNHTELTKILTEIDAADSDWDAIRLLPILEKYVAYFRTSGDYQPVGFALDQIIQSGQSNAEINYPKFHNLIDATVREVFSLDATDERLWIKWATSFLKLGASKEASLVLWEGLRRRPESERIAFALLKSFERTEYDFQNRIRFARMVKTRFHFNRFLELEYCRLNGQSKYFDQIKDGIESLISLIGNVESVRYETVSLAAMINRNWTRMNNENFIPELKKKLNTGLGRKHKLIATTAHRLFEDHGNFEAAKGLLSSYRDFTKNNHVREIFDNTIAKLLLATGSRENLVEAIELIRPYTSEPSQNHLAKLLFHRNEAGDWKEAEDLLRSNVEKPDVNYYAVSQLGALLMHYGENRKAEVVSLLSIHASENEGVAELLDIIVNNEFERLDDSTRFGIENKIHEENEFDPSGVSTIPIWSSGTNANDFTPDIPDDVRANGTLRRLKFEAEYGTQRSAETAKREIRTFDFGVLTEYLTFVGHEVLGMPEKLDSESVGTMAAKIVSAYASKDIGKLTDIVGKVPRLGVVSKFACAALGEEAASRSMERLQSDGSGAFPWERVLIANASRSKFGQNLIHRMSNEDGEYAANENRRRFSDLVGALVTLESIAA